MRCVPILARGIAAPSPSNARSHPSGMSFVGDAISNLNPFDMDVPAPPTMNGSNVSCNLRLSTSDPSLGSTRAEKRITMASPAYTSCPSPARTSRNLTPSFVDVNPSSARAAPSAPVTLAVNANVNADATSARRSMAILERGASSLASVVWTAQQPLLPRKGLAARRRVGVDGDEHVSDRVECVCIVRIARRQCRRLGRASDGGVRRSMTM